MIASSEWLKPGRVGGETLTETLTLPIVDGSLDQVGSPGAWMRCVLSALTRNEA
jgi:hypothetical protein